MAGASPGITVVDILAPLLFLAAWMGYAWYADGGGGRRTLMLRMHEYRAAWMQRMLRRENRIVDCQVVQLLIQNISFFASSTILLIGGFVAVLGAREQAMAVIADIPGARMTPPQLWEVKVLLLIVVFVYAFFKFTWALRQFNYLAIMIGSAPPVAEADTPHAQTLAGRAARIATRAGDHFNKAMRAFYFGLAGLGWFLGSELFLAVTTLVVVVIWRREFRSRTLGILGAVGEPVAAPTQAAA